MSNENNHENMDNQPLEISAPQVEDSGIGTVQEEEKRCETTSVGIVNNESENTGIAIKNMESQALKSLLAYDSDSSASETSQMKFDMKWQIRTRAEDSSSSSSSSSPDDDVSDDTSDDEEFTRSMIREVGAIRKQQNLKKSTKVDDMSLDDLPPVPDLSTLNINVEQEQFVHMGNVLGIVDKLVTVAAIPNSPAYDLDTVLFLENGKRPLGFVFDVLGQVTSPIYAVRFNTAEDIKNLQVEVGTKVYSAPLSKHTQYVFVQHLLKMKGTDASWLDDAEVPAEFADYSDDENESRQKHGTFKPGPHLKRTHSGDNYKKFESTMNRKNLLNTRFNKYMDSCKQTRFGRQKQKQGVQVPQYDPTVPPPNFGYVSYGSGGENNNAGQGYMSHLFANNFVANLSQTNSANYFTNHAGNSHPGPSHG